MKERVRRSYPFERDWDNHLRAQYAAQEMGGSQPVNPRDYKNGLPGYSEALKPIDVLEQPLA
jgi:hypothetical protein